MKSVCFSHPTTFRRVTKNDARNTWNGIHSWSPLQHFSENIVLIYFSNENPIILCLFGEKRLTPAKTSTSNHQSLAFIPISTPDFYVKKGLTFQPSFLFLDEIYSYLIDGWFLYWLTNAFHHNNVNKKKAPRNKLQIPLPKTSYFITVVFMQLCFSHTM